MADVDALTCQELVELVTDFLEGRLSAADRRRFDEHLVGCANCRIYLEQARQTIRLLGALSEETIAPGPRDELLERFRTWKATRPA